MHTIEIATIVLFFSSAAGIFTAMVGYPIFLLALSRLYKDRKNVKNYDYIPTVTVMIVAHNEDKVIKEKLINTTNLDYPSSKISFIVASDNSTDKTNAIVKNFKLNHKEINLMLHQTSGRMGKTNAQNEAFSLVKSELLVMTDANSMLDRNSIKELTASFSAPNIAYVTGRLVYDNPLINDTTEAEDTYWTIDLTMREIESRVQTITAGNGALYACRTKDYICLKPLESHDSSFPFIFAMQSKRCIFNPNAIATEKTSTVASEEFKRKVRMSRAAALGLLQSYRTLNIFKYRWFTIFYFGHRTLRYSLWINHALLLISNIFLAFTHIAFCIILIAHMLVYILAAVPPNLLNTRISQLLRHYILTIIAQSIGMLNTFFGRSKPFWDKAESTR